jgi:hypothetical protein
LHRFQTDVLVEENDASEMLRPRTLEEAIVYENFGLLRSGALSIGITVRASLSDAYQDVYDRVRSDNFKKLILLWTSWLALSNGLSLDILPKG